VTRRGSTGVFTSDGGAAAARVCSWHYLCKIKLSTLHDLFEQLPLTRNSFLKFTFYFNSSRQRLTCTHGGTTLVSAVPQVVGGTSPLLTSAGAVKNPLSAAHGGAGAVTGVARSTGEVTVAGVRVRHQPLTQRRTYTPLYQVQPACESRFLSENPSTSVRYKDTFQHYTSAVGPQQDVNQLVTSGTVNPTQLTVTPFTHKAENDLNCGTVQNPFTTEPGTTSTLPRITNFQVLVSGQAVYSNGPLEYSHDFFLRETSPLGLNGNNTVGLSSGLLDEFKWDQAHHYTVVDLTRRVPTGDGVSKSISLLFKNTANVAYDFLIFVKCGRELTVESDAGVVKAL
jgi:hypothetical protein